MVWEAVAPGVVFKKCHRVKYVLSRPAHRKIEESRISDAKGLIAGALQDGIVIPHLEDQNESNRWTSVHEIEEMDNKQLNLHAKSVLDIRI